MARLSLGSRETGRGRQRDKIARRPVRLIFTSKRASALLDAREAPNYYHERSLSNRFRFLPSPSRVRRGPGLAIASIST